MLEHGFVNLYRSLLSWEWYSDINTTRIFIHLLLTANYDTKVWRGMEIRRGQRVTSIDNLSRETGISVQCVRTALKHLLSTNEITSVSTNKNTVITINNYEKFQTLTNESKQMPQPSAQTSNKQLTTKEKDKNIKNKKDIYSSIQVAWNEICESLPKVTKMTESRKQAVKKSGANEDEICEVFRKIENSDFLSGRSGKWQTNFDWVFKPKNWVKIIEGVYDNRSNASYNLKDFENEPIPKYERSGKNYDDPSRYAGETDELPQW